MSYSNNSHYAYSSGADLDLVSASALTCTFNSPKTGAQLASLKTVLETAFVGVGVTYVQQPNGSYQVTVSGPKQKQLAAMRFLNPRVHPWIRQPSQYGPDPDHFVP